MKFLKMDSPIIRFMETIADLMLLNVLFLLSILPIFTIGASCAALAAVAKDIIYGEKRPVASHFLQVFKANCVKGTILSVFGLVTLFAFRMWFLYSSLWFTNANLSLFIKIVLFFGVALFFAMAIWIFSIMGNFHSSIKQTISLALVLCFRHLFTTVTMLLVLLAPMMLTVIFGVNLLFLWLILGVSLVAIGINRLAYPLLSLYL